MHTYIQFLYSCSGIHTHGSAVTLTDRTLIKGITVEHGTTLDMLP